MGHCQGADALKIEKCAKNVQRQYQKSYLTYHLHLTKIQTKQPPPPHLFPKGSVFKIHSIKLFMRSDLAVSLTIYLFFCRLVLLVR